MKFDDLVIDTLTPPPLSEQELKVLGLDEVAYIRQYRVRDEIAWVLHAADGTAIAVQKNPHAALDSARAQDLSLATVH